MENPGHKQLGHEDYPLVSTEVAKTTHFQGGFLSPIAWSACSRLWQSALDAQHTSFFLRRNLQRQLRKRRKLDWKKCEHALHTWASVEPSWTKMLDLSTLWVPIHLLAWASPFQCTLRGSVDDSLSLGLWLGGPVRRLILQWFDVPTADSMECPHPGTTRSFSCECSMPNPQNKSITQDHPSNKSIICVPLLWAVEEVISLWWLWNVHFIIFAANSSGKKIT